MALKDLEKRLRKVEGCYLVSPADCYLGLLLDPGCLASLPKQEIALLAYSVGHLEEGECVLEAYARALDMSGVEELQQALRAAETWETFLPVHERGMRRLWAVFGRLPDGPDYTRDPEAAAWMDYLFFSVPEPVWRELGVLVVLDCEDFNV
jgi:hypothetical protein